MSSESSGGCRIPSEEEVQQMSANNTISMAGKFWLICYTCERRPTKRSPVADYDFYPGGGRSSARAVASESKKARVDYGTALLNRTLSSLGSSLLFRGRLDAAAASRENAEMLLKKTERAVASLTPIVKQDEVLAFDVSHVGQIRLAKGRATAADKVAVPESAIEGNVVSVVHFESHVSDALHGDEADNSTLSDIVAVSLLNPNSSTTVEKKSLNRAVSMVFKHKALNESDDAAGLPPMAFRARCVYWNFEVSDWMSDGCTARWVRNGFFLLFVL